MIDICKRDIDSEIDLGSRYFIEYDNGKCYNCRKIGKCKDLHLKIMYLINCDDCEERDDGRTCKSCLSYLTYLIENNKFNKLIRYNIRVLLDKHRYNRLNSWS